MVHDTVREELETKIGRGSGPLMPKAETASGPLDDLDIPPMPAEVFSTAPAAAAAAPAPAPKPPTMNLPPKKTSPTLVDFQPRSATLPDWRLQLQNAVRQRALGTVKETAEAPAVATVPPPPPARETKSRTAELRELAAKHPNETVSNALRRIEASRRAFNPQAERNRAVAKAAKERSFPFDVVSRAAEGPVRTAPAPAIPAPKPKLVSPLRIEKKAYDTNKLPPLAEPQTIDTEVEEPSTPLMEAVPEPPAPIAKAPRKLEMVIDDLAPAPAFETELPEPEPVDEYDDLPPLSMRFGAGFFDLVIGAAGTMIIVSPFLLGGGEWLSLSGVLAFTAALSIFQFLYLTASLGFWGKTFGMRIFSLELIDAEQNAYPTVHQAAVNSAVYLLSIAFAGAGFLTMLYNEEKRAFHDIVSGTLLIREI